MSNMFLALTGDGEELIIKGESLAENYEEEIEIHEWTWAVNNPAAYGLAESQATKHAHFGPITIHKLFDKASVTLINYCAHGTRIADATISCLKNAGNTEGAMMVEYLTIELMDVKVDSVTWAGRAGVEHGIPEQVQLSFQKLEVTYSRQDENGDLQDSNAFPFDVSKQEAEPAKPGR
jgi:type VI secretion system secreted protein Hcp